MKKKKAKKKNNFKAISKNFDQINFDLNQNLTQSINFLVFKTFKELENVRNQLLNDICKKVKEITNK